MMHGADDDIVTRETSSDADVMTDATSSAADVMTGATSSAADVMTGATSSAGDVVAPATSLDRNSSSDSTSVRRGQLSVLEASSRTAHTLSPAAAERDPRYGSGDNDIDRLWRALGEVADPELPISLVDLGLICDVRRAGTNVEVDVTFTATACPCMGFIIEDIRDRLLRESDVLHVHVGDVWDPPWTTARMTEHGRTLLRSFGVAA